MKADLLQRWDLRYLWHPFTQQAEWAGREPIVIESGRGVWLKDTRGRQLLDGNSSLWVNVFGHSHPLLNRALSRQTSRIAHSTFLGLTHEPAIRLARELVCLAPPGLSRVFYSDNGSTSVEVALKMAYQYWQLTGHPKKQKFVSLRNGYHGDTIGSVSVGGVDLFHERFRGLLFNGWHVKAPSPRLGRGEGEGDMAAVLREHHRSIAAVVMEPLIQGASGMLLMRPGYLREVRRLCDRYKVLLIVDEVATGFGRTGRMFACEHEGVTPDFLCVAKSLTAGYLPLAATITKERIFRAFLGRFDEFRTFFHGHTYTANPLACAVALANLDLYRKTHVLANARKRAVQMAKALAPLAGHPHVKEIRQLGLMAGIELVEDKATGRAYPPGQRVGLKVCDAAIRRGVWLRPLGDVIVLMPPLIINEGEMALLCRVLAQSVEEETRKTRT